MRLANRLAVVTIAAVAVTTVTVVPPTDAAHVRDADAAPASVVPAAHSRLGAVLRRVERRLSRGTELVRGYERTGRRMDRWFSCIAPLRVDQVGDVQHRWGFQYDEMDGTGLDTRPALAVHHGRSRPDLLLLRFSRSEGCASRAPDPNGTGADARQSHPRRPDLPGGNADRRRSRHGLRREVRRLERRMTRLDDRIRGAERAFDRFDEWESCLSWLPVTELGREEQNLGYLFDTSQSPTDQKSSTTRRVAGIDIDASEWDDPDYELLTFLGRDRPFTARECGHEPGEETDRRRPPLEHAAASIPGSVPSERHRRSARWLDRLADLGRDVAGAREDLEDLLEPVEEFIQFDECMYTVGIQDRGTEVHGYRFTRRNGTVERRAALSFDMRGLDLPEMDVLAFSGEEPPQIECNEDASGQSTDE